VAQRLARLAHVKSRLFERTLRRKDGTALPVEISVKHLPDGTHQAIVRDISERRQQALKIDKLSRVRAVTGEINSLIVRVRDRQELFAGACRIAVEHGGFGIAWIGACDARALEVTPVASAGLDEGLLMSGKTPVRADSPQGGNLVAVAVRERRAAVNNDIAADAHVGGRRRQEAVRRGCRSAAVLPLVVDGEVYGNLSLYAKEAGFFDDEELALLAGLAENIAFALEHMARQERLDFLSFYDALTGLPNRTLFLDRAGQQLRARGGEPLMVALVLFDIERFQYINETLGRRGGDELLKVLAQRLQDAFSGSDYLARIGSNAFGVVIRGIRDAAGLAHAVEDRVLGCLREPFRAGEAELRLTAKAGIAVYPADGDDADILFRNAEAALKRAKDTGERYLFYAADMHARAVHVLSMETRLRKAVEARQFLLHYQPKIALASGAISGMEALIRWQDPEGGLVAPGAFIPVLEQTGLILDAGRWALRQALADYRQWTARGCSPPRVAVNVSAIQLQHRDFVDTVADAVREAGDLTGALEIEVTESLLMRDMQASVRKLSTLRGMGIHVAMDDFGTGYSSLSYLARLPINLVKIDRSFIGGMTTSDQDRAIVTTILALAKSLGLKVVAEGVETAEQARLLSALGCDEAQGFLYSKPVAAGEMERLLLACAPREDAP
jgi:diguanylate cyclase (GGDEF)-like protein